MCFEFPLPAIEAPSPLALHLVETLFEARNDFIVDNLNEKYELAAHHLGRMEVAASALHIAGLLPLVELTKIRARIHTWFDLA